MSWLPTTAMRSDRSASAGSTSSQNSSGPNLLQTWISRVHLRFRRLRFSSNADRLTIGRFAKARSRSHDDVLRLSGSVRLSETVGLSELTLESDGCPASPSDTS